MSSNNIKKSEPLIRVSKREFFAPWLSWAVRGAALIVAAIIVSLFVFSLVGITPGTTFSVMFEGAFGNEFYRKGTIFFSAKLLCIAIALAPAFKMRFWNIGAEGQVLAGAMATALVMVKFSTLPPALLFTMMIIAAVFAGAAWGVIPALFKAQWNVNETLFTLMMNYVAIQIMDYFYNNWKGHKASLGKLNQGSKAGYLPEIMNDSNLLIVLIVLIIAVIMMVYLNRTKHGYEIAVVGSSENTARYAGISVKKVIVRTMLVSGAICGICGFLTVSGHDHSIASSSTAGGYGFTAIIVAWLAKFNTLVMVIISVFVIFLERGTANIANKYPGFDANASQIVIGIFLFCVIGCEFFINYKLNFRGKKED